MRKETETTIHKMKVSEFNSMTTSTPRYAKYSHTLTSSGSTKVEGMALHFLGPGNLAVENTVVARFEPRTELTLPSNREENNKKKHNKT